ncbi:MAG TPA: lasso peptide biosynthesis B2 protein [Gemmatimonadaceae bacterium]|nr:lasso peptide biosynthesis B2 protein [Gemmatimonadaceae bacterium]
MVARRRAPWWHKAEVVAASLLLPLALELFSGARVMGAVRRLPRRARPTGESPQDIADRVDHVLYKMPWIWRRTCLRRAIVLAALLRRDGLDPEVVIGVRRSPQGSVEAHAWLRCDGTDPYLEPTDTSTYIEMKSGANG